jgi:hypothetical protein
MPNPRSTKLAIFGPPVEFRVSADELQGLLYGCSLLRWYLFDLAFRRYDSELSERLDTMCVEVLRLASEKRGERVRVNADALGIAALMFSLRSIPREMRRGRIPLRCPADPKYGTLLKRLERVRRRAKRLWLRVGSNESYLKARTRWHRFVDGVHANPVRQKSVIRDHYEKRINAILAIAKVFLATQAPYWVPLDADLRPMVRAALRHIRRGRASVTMKDLVCETAEGISFLSEYVGRLVNKLFWRRMQELEAKDAPSSQEEETEAFAIIRGRARGKARGDAIRKNLYPPPNEQVTATMIFPDDQV